MPGSDGDATVSAPVGSIPVLNTRDGRVTVIDPEHMILLGLLLRGLLADRLADASTFERARRIRGDVEVTAGSMAVTLRFGPTGVEIHAGRIGDPGAAVEGDVGSLLGAVSGDPLARSVLARSIRVRGSIVMLVRLLRLLRAPGPEVAR